MIEIEIEVDHEIETLMADAGEDFIQEERCLSGKPLIKKILDKYEWGMEENN